MLWYQGLSNCHPFKWNLADFQPALYDYNIGSVCKLTWSNEILRLLYQHNLLLPCIPRHKECSLVESCRSSLSLPLSLDRVRGVSPNCDRTVGRADKLTKIILLQWSQTWSRIVSFNVKTEAEKTFFLSFFLCLSTLLFWGPKHAQNLMTLDKIQKWWKCKYFMGF